MIKGIVIWGKVGFALVVDIGILAVVSVDTDDLVVVVVVVVVVVKFVFDVALAVIVVVSCWQNLSASIASPLTLSSLPPSTSLLKSKN